jgi:DNA-directed RNA polymerase specialized sigma24 family protein
MNDHALHIFNWAYKKTNNNEDAEDLMQEIMLQLVLAFHHEQKRVCR